MGISILCVCVMTAPGAQRSVPIVPKPRVVVDLGGTVAYQPGQTAIRLAVRDSAAVMPAIADLCTTSVVLYGGVPSSGGKGRLVVHVGVFGDDPAFDRLCASKGLKGEERLGDEGYHLSIDPGAIVVAGRTSRGAFYGLQSFHQLLRASSSAKGKLPAVRITDWPDLRVRAVMDDISRGPVPTPAYFRQQIRRCAEMKVNTMCYYIEHVVATRSHPDFAPPGGAVSIDEWKEIAAYARSYHIDLIGNFQSFGHFDKILATPRYAHLGDSKSLLSPALDESYAFLREIYQEMVPAFSSRYFNVNCDETFDLGRGRSKALVDSLGKGVVYLNHVLRLREILQSLGVRMIIWGDILLEHPEMIDRVPKDVVIGTWTYDSLADFRRYITPFTSRGLDVLVTPGVLNSLNVMPNFRQSFANIRRFVQAGVAEQVMGALMTVWDDGGNAQFQRDWYGVAFAADQMWHSDTLDTTFPQRFDVALYG
ncbi:MAG TPA: glycoside hydrolase family 20 zincin-like fold domain-containing protein, partial [Bacteroidota bacterium]|nr:glycoside hydrolase family 20 zincin-like fold domain-containing protein [Bacteroidota bacterium]